MVFPSCIVPIRYSGNGTVKDFAVPFRFLENSHVKITFVDVVTRVEVVKTLNVDYTLTGALLQTGGTATFYTAPPSGQEVLIDLDVPISQLTDYIEGDPFPAESHENALDKLTMLTCQNHRHIERSIRVPEGEDTDISNLILPAAPDRADKFIGFDATGANVIMTTSAAVVGDGTITNTKLAPMPPQTVKVNNQNVSAQPIDLNIPPSTVLGADDVGNVVPLTLGVNLSITGGVLDATGAFSPIPPDGSVTLAKLAPNSVDSSKIIDGSVTNADLANVPANTIKANTTGSAAPPQDIPLAPNQILMRGATGALIPHTLGPNITANAGIVNAVLPSGVILQRVYSENNNVISVLSGVVANIIPLDTSIPQINEGVQVLSGTITPTSNTHRIRIRVHGAFTALGVASSAVVSAFRGVNPSAIYATYLTTINSGAGTNVAIEFEDVPNTILPTTYTIRFGHGLFAAGGGATLNAAINGTQYFGGVNRWTLTIEEIS